MVRAFAHGAMGHRIDPSWWIHCAIFRSTQCPTTGVTKAVVCVILSVGCNHLAQTRNDIFGRRRGGINSSYTCFITFLMLILL